MEKDRMKSEARGTHSAQPEKRLLEEEDVKDKRHKVEEGASVEQSCNDKDEKRKST